MITVMISNRHLGFVDIVNGKMGNEWSIAEAAIMIESRVR